MKSLWAYCCGAETQKFNKLNFQTSYEVSPKKQCFFGGVSAKTHTTKQNHKN